MLKIEQRKLWRNSNGHNFWLGCPIQALHISRCSKLNNGSYEEIQMVITLHSDVGFRHITYWDAQNWTMKPLEIFKWSKLFPRISDSGASHIEMHEIEQRKLWRNSNGHNFSLGCPIQVYHISRRSKLNNGSSKEMQMVIAFDSDVKFWRITYRDALNWKSGALEKFYWS